MTHNELNIPENEKAALQALITKAREILASTPARKENLSLGTLEYLNKYKIRPQ